jgi:hypothetical protein
MGLYAITNSEDKFLGANSVIVAEWTNDLAVAARYTKQSSAEYDASRYNARIVELGVPAVTREPKTKRYVLPMEGTNSWSGDEDHIYAFILARCGGRPVWTTTGKPLSPDAPVPSVAKIDYDLAPAWVRAITPVEVKNENL